MSFELTQGFSLGLGDRYFFRYQENSDRKAGETRHLRWQAKEIGSIQQVRRRSRETAEKYDINLTQD